MARKKGKFYPLYLHKSGNFAKKIRGRTVYFGRDFEEALAKYEQQKDALYAGREPDELGEQSTVGEACNAYMSRNLEKRNNGDIALKTYQNYYDACVRTVEHFGSHRTLESLTPSDFADLRAELAKRYSTVKLLNVMIWIRSIFKYALNVERMIDRPVDYGDGFSVPTKRELRRARNGKSKQLFTAEEIWSMTAAAPEQIRAMIWLGINCGFEPHDCGQLQWRHLDLVEGWHDFSRPKEGIERRCPLWPETLDLLRERRLQVKSDDYVFRTKYGRLWWREEDNKISTEFRKLMDRLEMYEKGRTVFLTLRHTFRTVARSVRDPGAIRKIMGHVDSSIDDTYIEDIEDADLLRVTDFVYKWLHDSASSV